MLLDGLPTVVFLTLMQGALARRLGTFAYFNLCVVNKR
jgi:hypothetical protein